MRKRKNDLILILLCVAVLTCLIFTGLILWKNVASETDQEISDIRMKNAYIVDTTNEEIRILYEGENYVFPGRMEKEYQGIADVVIENGNVSKIYSKPDSIDGILDSYTEEKIEIRSVGTMDCQNDFPVYSLINEQVEQRSMSDMVVGQQNLTYVFEKGKICAVIEKEASTITDIRVLIRNGSGLFYTNVYLTSDQAWTIADKKMKAEQTYNAADAFTKEEQTEIVAGSEAGKLYLCDGSGNKISEGYEGEFQIRKTEDGFLIVNCLPVEDYVRYVLPSEMPRTYHEEALKVQAICARTFAYTQMRNAKYAAYGANLDDSTAYQVYNSTGNYAETDQATKDTVGQVLTSEGKLVHCYYFSTSAGITETMEVWENEESPSYLTRRNCLIGVKEMPDLSDEDTFRDFIKSSPQSYDSGSAYYRWKATVDLASIRDSELGTLQSIRIDRRSKSGTVTALYCEFEDGTRTLHNENQIRTLLGAGQQKLVLADDSTREFTMIPSACFWIAGEDGTTVTLQGGGFGHGIGMSQCGAGAMAESGLDCAQILKFYYPGTSIEKIS